MDIARRLIGAALLIAVSNFATAGVVVTPVAVTPYTSSAQNVMATATFEGRMAAQSTSVAQGLYYQRAVTFSQAQMASASRSRIAMAVGGAAALSAAVLAVGYFLDSVTGDIYTAQGTAGHPAVSSLVWYANGVNTGQTTPTAAANWYFVNTWTYANDPYSHIAPSRKTSGTNWMYLWNLHYNNGVVNENLQITPSSYALANQWTGFVAASTNFASTPSTTATDQQVHDAVRASPDAVREALHNPDGTPRVVQPMPAIMDEVAAQYRADTAQPLASGETETPNTTTPDPTPTSTSWPSFCAWASVVCSAVDWMKAPPPTSTDADVSIDSAPVVQQTFVSGLGGGSCPAPIARSVTLKGVVSLIEFSYQPMCDFAALIYPLTVVMSLLLSAYILAGVKMHV